MAHGTSSASAKGNGSASPEGRMNRRVPAHALEPRAAHAIVAVLACADGRIRPVPCPARRLERGRERRQWPE